MLLSSMTTFSRAYADADFFGKLIFLGLFALSGMTWIVLLYKIWYLRETKKHSSEFSGLILKQKEALMQVGLEGLKKQSLTTPFGQVYMTLKERTREILDKNHFFLTQRSHEVPIYLSRTDVELIEGHLLSAINTEKEKMEKHLFLLPMITSLAPFLGLLGTVWGILITFNELGKGGGSNNIILGGLSTALVTTVLGLLIAIPSLIGYTYLRNGVQAYFSQMQGFAHHLLSVVELQYRKVDLN